MLYVGLQKHVLILMLWIFLCCTISFHFIANIKRNIMQIYIRFEIPTVQHCFKDSALSRWISNRQCWHMHTSFTVTNSLLVDVLWPDISSSKLILDEHYQAFRNRRSGTWFWTKISSHNVLVMLFIVSHINFSRQLHLNTFIDFFCFNKVYKITRFENVVFITIFWWTIGRIRRIIDDWRNEIVQCIKRLSI